MSSEKILDEHAINLGLRCEATLLGEFDGDVNVDHQTQTGNTPSRLARHCFPDYT